MGDPTLAGQLLDTRRIRHRINLYLLDSLADEARERREVLAFAHPHDS